MNAEAPLRSQKKTVIGPAQGLGQGPAQGLGQGPAQGLGQGQGPAQGPSDTRTKREEVCEKMNARHLVGRASQNPFLVHTTYLEDLEVQNNFLVPRNTTREAPL